jgi:hypothetical protein
MTFKLKSPLLIGACKAFSDNSPDTEFKHQETDQGEVLQAFWYSNRHDTVACFSRSEGGWYFSHDDDAGLLNIQLHADGRIEVMPPAGDAVYVSGRLGGIDDLAALLKALRELQATDVIGVELENQPLAHLLT